MKKCSYCGRDNTDEALHCDECGTEFAREVVDSESDNKLHDEVKRTTIRTFISHESAELAAANLKAHGIQCWINSDDGGGMMPYLTAPGGVRLLVRASDAEAAIALLDAQASPAEINQIEIEATASTPAGNSPVKKLAMGQIGFGILSGIVIGILLCLLYQWVNTLGIQAHYHYGTDGKPDEAWIYHNGDLMEYRQDRNHDGEWDHRTYYERGRIIRSEYDNNFDGKPDIWWTFSADETDTVQMDTDFNGIPDEFDIYKNAMPQQIDIRPNGSKFTTTREIFQNGVLTEILRGGDSNGNFKEDVHYDPFFNSMPIDFNPTDTNALTGFQLLSPVSK
jgi:hypothetical protein